MQFMPKEHNSVHGFQAWKKISHNNSMCGKDGKFANSMHNLNMSVNEGNDILPKCISKLDSLKKQT